MQALDLEQKPTFTDAKGRVWNLELNVGIVEDAREKAGVNLDKVISEPAQLADLVLQEPAALARLLWVICEDQAKDAGVDPRDFGKSLNRDAIDGAADALIRAIVLFFPRASAGKAMAEALPKILADMDAKIQATVTKALSSNATDSAAL